MSFQGNFGFGRIGENYILRYLLRKGWAILPVYELETEQHHKGPRLTAPDKELIAPDCLVFRQGVVRWIEAKHKTCFSWHWKTGAWTTGIDLHCYEHYLEIRQRYGFDLWLLFLHLEPKPSPEDLRRQCPPACPSGLFGGEILSLKDREHHRHGNWGPSGMVYWADLSLRHLATADEVMAIIRKPLGAESGVEFKKGTA